MKYIIDFKDGFNATIDTEIDEIEINSLSYIDIELNNIANKAMNGSETDKIRLINNINNRLGVEAI